VDDDRVVDNSIRVQKDFVLRKWIVPVVLFMAVLPFIAISLLPFFGGADNNQQAGSSPSESTATTTDAKKSELQAQEKAYEAVLQREPENQTALKGLLQTRLEMVQLGMGDVKEVIEPLEKLAKLNPDQTNYQVLLAQAKQQVGDREGAAQTYRTILATQPGNSDALRGLVTVLVQQQKPEAAIELLQDTLQKAPQANQAQPGSIDVPAVQLLLAEVYAIQKRYDDAIALYNQLSQANKNDFRPVVGKALVLKQQGKPEAAKPLFESAISLAPAQYKDQIKQLASQSPATRNPLAPSPSP
jgi:tetratricopeptide (TPR) repeat protein